MKNAKQRILFIITQAEWGGAQNYVFKAANEAIARGFEVLITAGGEGTLETRCKEANIPYQKLLKMKREIKPLAEFPAIFELVSIMRVWKPDVAFLFSAKAGVVGSIAARLAGVKRVVYRIGGWSWLDPVSDRQKLIRSWTEMLVAPLKDTIIVQHPGDKKEAEDHHIKPRKGVVIAPNGLDINTFDSALLPRDKARLKLEELWNKGTTVESQSSLLTSHFSPLVVTIANFYATKDLSNFLHAAKIVHDHKPNVRFMVMGDGGDQREKIHELRRTLQLESVVSFPGSVSNAQTFLAGADIFALTSAKEGNPWTVHEAMAARIPVIATDVGACSWLLQNNAGWIVPPKNSEALAEAIFEALDQPEEAIARRDRARQNCETLFTEKIMWERTFEALEG
jgi:glycosyltransferase involved in cell wall biosynthesis